MSGGSGSSDRRPRVEIPGGRGIQVGDRNVQVNIFGRRILVSIVLMVAAVIGVLVWWRYPLMAHSSAPPASAVAGMTGGCTAYEAIAQNRYPPYGTAIRTQPNALSTKIGSYSGNSVISVNGWVYGTAAYPTNRPPWNSNIWFHLSDGAGWVSFPGVRAYPMTPDPDGLNPNGGPPVATPASCEGGIQ